MAKFHAEWSAKIADAMIPYLVDINSDADLSPEKAEKNKALYILSSTIKEWAASRTEQGKITVDMGKCNRTYTRFRTTFMDGVIPDAPGTKSGWNTTNHYFYEVVNRTGKSLFVQLALSSKEMPIEFRIFGDINATIYTSLPSIMGARGQKFQKEIDGTDIILEVKGYSYQNKIYSNLKLDVEINGKIAEKALKYSIIAKGSDERPRDQKLYLSELQVGLKSEKRINFKQSVIPDIYICSDDNYKTNKICIELRDCQKDKVIGKNAYMFFRFINFE